MIIPEVQPSDRRSNVPVRQLQLTPNLSLEGFSRAAIQTYYRLPEVPLLLDCGNLPLEFVSTPTMAVSHAHPDHIGGLISYIAARAMQRLAPPKVIVPAAIKTKVQAWIAATEQLQDDRHECELLGLEPGEMTPLGKQLFLKSLPVSHALPASGYQVVEQRHHLKAEFQGKPGEDIATARKVGQEIYDYESHGLLAYSGDMATDSLNRSEFLESDVLICEMSFLADEQEQLAVKHGHVWLPAAAEVLAGFRGSKLVLTHFSMRYSEDEIVERIRQSLPQTLLDRTVLWL